MPFECACRKVAVFFEYCILQRFLAFQPSLKKFAVELAVGHCVTSVPSTRCFVSLDLYFSIELFGRGEPVGVAVLPIGTSKAKNH